MTTKKVINFWGEKRVHPSGKSWLRLCAAASLKERFQTSLEKCQTDVIIP